MPYKLLPVLVVFAVMVILGVLVTLGVGHSQTTVINPNGSITYVYPGTPAVILAPNGGVSYVYPGAVPLPAPIVVPIIPAK